MSRYTLLLEVSSYSDGKGRAKSCKKCRENRRKCEPGPSLTIIQPAAGPSKCKAKREASPQNLKEEEICASTPDEPPAVDEESQSEGPVSRTHTSAPLLKEE
ncbi:hypothetical protein BDZ89DRAFT_1044798 [Hymenopellis radicata]|nr:hypothetical protein BDZ89DRAFT_1044798 [Hymenopellis radicata]